MTDLFTVEVAEDLHGRTASWSFDLGDATLKDAPADQPDDVVRALLEAAVEELTARGVTTPNGDPYVAASLMSMRRTAIMWAPADRHPEAAYRTHQEAGPTGTQGRAALAALAAVARGEAVDRPEGLDGEAWESAVARVEKRLAGKKTPRYTVTANDVRVAVQRTMNIPTRPDPLEPGHVVHLYGEVANAGRALSSFARRFVEAELTETDRNGLLGALVRLQGRVEATLSAVEAGGMSDDALRELLEAADD